MWPAVLLLLVLAQILLSSPDALLPSAVALAATAAASAALAACVVLAARTVPPVPHHRVRTAMRDREIRTAFLPQRDPDARGRTRPRAPGRRLPTAA
ncbi:DUF6412 domain-containing protein [Streptomyces fuscigenes]|uniref:DUF6412 domain-containing protein n=1 Tax=Streptomyces fuscigenes TaxID=1528880 RepID=UPI001F1D8C25|nr:DUF6412 domain-containing protein [Streptomyces fuscigenes]MCF3961045.1 DUF6412 domain-containing protein [Streptomyces fuscigenes]